MQRKFFRAKIRSQHALWRNSAEVDALFRLEYASVILGRRGLSTIQDLALGGVANKVVLRASDLAV